MLRLMLTRRWLGLLLAVLVVGLACVELGLWQFRRYDERKATNLATERNLKSPPAPVSDVLTTREPPPVDVQWQTVAATGTYDAARQLLVLYRTRDGAPGVDVVVPLRTDDGTALLVDRGWVQTTGNGNQALEVPAPPTGHVQVTGWARAGAEGEGAETTPADGSVRAISSDAIGQTLPYDVYDGFVDLTAERPAPATAPQRATEPDLGSGPSFFYGVQWFFFALLAFGFWVYFAWSEYQQRDAEPGLVTTPSSSLRPPEASPR